MGTKDSTVEILATALAIDKTSVDSAEFEATLAQALGETIAPTVNAKGTASDRARQMLTRAVENRSSRLTLGETLGEGGMGLVRSAKQADLGRDVAVKTLRPEIPMKMASPSLFLNALKGRSGLGSSGTRKRSRHALARPIYSSGT
jgi:hypothetical protein